MGHRRHVVLSDRQRSYLTELVVQQFDHLPLALGEQLAAAPGPAEKRPQLLRSEEASGDRTAASEHRREQETDFHDGKDP